MKQFILVLLMLALGASLAACTSSGEAEPQSTPPQTDSPETTQPVQSQDVSPEESVIIAEGESESGKTLVAYFSWSGNTQAMAQMIQEHNGADLFAIEPETPYTDNYNELLDIAQSEQRSGARPALAAQVENWDEYDVIFVGYPKLEYGFLCV